MLDRRFTRQESLWVTHASGAAISAFALSDDGTITLIDGRAAQTRPAQLGIDNPLANADGPTDLDVSADGQNLYQLLGLRGTINIYDIGASGSL